MTRPPRGRACGDAAANGSGKITRQVVLAAALEIIDAGGAGALSMRRLARALGPGGEAQPGKAAGVRVPHRPSG